MAMTKRVYEVGFAAKPNGRWEGNWSRRIVVVTGAVREAIAKAERLERKDSISEKTGRAYPIRSEFVKLITEAE